mmetsp:Transcript_122750/g.281458  ORF Transcript_122750/g.281458 Transcript_122750/m.281458 type:complete len:241 (-) Transcript_122750:260-982(-)
MKLGIKPAGSGIPLTAPVCRLIPAPAVFPVPVHHHQGQSKAQPASQQSGPCHCDKGGPQSAQQDCWGLQVSQQTNNSKNKYHACGAQHVSRRQGGLPSQHEPHVHRAEHGHSQNTIIDPEEEIRHLPPRDTEHALQNQNCAHGNFTPFFVVFPATPDCWVVHLDADLNDSSQSKGRRQTMHQPQLLLPLPRRPPLHLPAPHAQRALHPQPLPPDHSEVVRLGHNGEHSRSQLTHLGKLMF